jgi:hypothetical protein
MAASAGMMPSGLSQSVFAVSTQMTRAAGNPQNNADKPRARRPSERSNSGLGGASGMTKVKDAKCRMKKQEQRAAVI